MVLSAALDNGYVFITLIAILTSVIGAVYYLNIIKEIFFYSPDLKLNNEYFDIHSKEDTNFNSNFLGMSSSSNNNKITIISSPFSITISIITLVILLFIFMNKE
jgi:NADH-ubiquinone oxidoreductase chain 2